MDIYTCYVLHNSLSGPFQNLTVFTFTHAVSECAGENHTSVDWMGNMFLHTLPLWKIIDYDLIPGSVRPSECKDMQNHNVLFILKHMFYGAQCFIDKAPCSSYGQ